MNYRPNYTLNTLHILVKFDYSYSVSFVKPITLNVAQESSTSVTLRFIFLARCLAVGVLLLAIVVLLDWYFAFDISDNPKTYFKTMNPVSALSFLITSISLLLLSKKYLRGAMVVVCVGGCLIFIFAATRIFPRFIGIDFHLDEFFFYERMLAFNKIAPVRMALNAAFNFLCLGSALVLVSMQRKMFKVVANYVCLITFFGGLFAGITYAYNVKEFYGMLHYIPMSIWSAIAFITASLSLFLINSAAGFMSVPSHSYSGGTIARILLPATIIFPFFVGYIRLLAHNAFAISVELGVSFLITGIIFLFLMLVFYVSHVINKKDSLTRIAEEKLTQSNAELENKVHERTLEIYRNEKRFRTLIENNSSAIYLLDKDFNILYRSSSAIAITGWTDEERQSNSGIDQTHPDDVETLTNTMQESMANPGKPIRTTFRTLHKGGHYVWLESVMTNMLHDKDIEAIIGNLWDITDRIQAQEKIYESNTSLNAIFQSVSEGITFIDTNGIIKTFNGKAADITFKSSGLRLAPGLAIAEFVEESRKVFFNQMLLNVLAGEKIEYDRPYNFPGEPLIWYNVSFNPVWDADKIIGACLTTRDITERKLAEDRLGSSEKRFRALIENSTDAIFLTDRDLVISYQSPSVERMTGISLEFRNSSRSQGINYTHPDDVAMVKKVVEEALNHPGVPIPFQSRFRHLDGHYLWIEGMTTNLLDDANVNALTFNYRDVTERKAMEDQQKLFVSIVDSSDDAILSRNLDGIITSWNKGAEKLFNYSSEEVIGQPIAILSPSGLADEEVLILDKIKKGDSVDHYETIRRKKSGEIIHVSLTISPIRDSIGNIIGASKIARDISERKQAEIKLAASEQRFRTLIENISDAIVVNDEHSNLIYQSPSVTRILGYLPEERQGMSVLNYVHPENKNDFLKLYDDLKQHPGVTIPFQYRFLHKNGNYIWLEGVITNLLHDGNVRAYVANYRNISERKLSEEKLHNERVLLRTLIDNLPDYIYVKDTQSRHLINNKANVDLFGALTEGETIGKTAADILGTEVAAPYLADDRRIFNSGVPVIDHEETIVSPAGETKYLLTTKVPLKDEEGKIIGLVGISRDVTRQKNVELDLRNTNYFLQMAQHVGRIGLWILGIDLAGSLTWSEETCHIFGITPDTFDNRKETFFGFVHPEDLSKVQYAMNRAIENKEIYSIDHRIVLRDGSVKWVHEQGEIAHNVQGAKTMIGIIQDITERKGAEEEIVALNTELEERVLLRTEQLQAANKEMESFAYSISHDLRAPLRIINGYSQILLEDYGVQLDESAKKTINIITANALKMVRLIDDLLEFSRLGTAAINKHEVDMENLVKDVVQELHLSGIPIPEGLVVGTLKPAYCDSGLMKLVWSNLISNAIKYASKKERVAVKIGMKNSDGKSLIYYVKDNGAGFDMKYQDKLFGVFQRLHKVEDFPGTGVGLAIVQRIIMRHGGKVWAEAKVNEGATFYFSVNSETV
jgi:PAS domain S-box-containing protein